MPEDSKNERRTIIYNVHNDRKLWKVKIRDYQEFKYSVVGSAVFLYIVKIAL